MLPVVPLWCLHVGPCPNTHTGAPHLQTHSLGARAAGGPARTSFESYTPCCYDHDRDARNVCASLQHETSPSVDSHRLFIIFSHLKWLKIYSLVASDQSSSISLLLFPFDELPANPNITSGTQRLFSSFQQLLPPGLVSVRSLQPPLVSLRPPRTSFLPPFSPLSNFLSQRTKNTGG